MTYFERIQLNQRVRKTFLMTIFVGMAFYSHSSYAALTVNAATMLENLSKTIPNLMQLSDSTCLCDGNVLYCQRHLWLEAVWRVTNSNVGFS